MYGISDYITGTLTTGSQSIEIPTISLTITAFYEGTQILASFETLTLRLTGGVIPDYVAVTDVNGQVLITEHYLGGLIILTSNSSIITYDQSSAQVQAEDIELNTETLKFSPQTLVRGTNLLYFVLTGNLTKEALK